MLEPQTPEQRSLFAETAHEENYVQLSLLADAMPQLVWIAEPNGKVIYYNNRVGEFAGALKHADGSWSWEGMVHEEDALPTQLAWEKAVATGVVYEIEHRVKMKDGSYRWHLSRAFPQHTEGGEVIKWFGTATDVHEQRMVGERIRQAEERWRTALEATEVGTWEYYPDDQTFFLSDMAKKIRGFDSDMSNRFHMHRATIHPDDADKVERTIQHTVDTEDEEVFVLEYRIMNLIEGKWRWLRSIGRFIAEAGKPSRIIGVMQDITVQKEAQQKLQYLATLTVNIADAVIGTDPAHVIMNWNKGAEEIYGWTAEEAMGQQAKDLLHTRFLHSREYELFLNDFPVYGRWQGEVEQTRKDGSKVFIHASLAMVADEDGQYIGSVAVNKDVTAQRQAAQLLQESEERFRVLTNTIPQIVWISDPLGRLVFMNDQWERITGQDANVEGVNTNEPVHPDDVSQIMAKWEVSLLNREVYDAEYRLKLKNGAYHWFHCKALPIKDDSGEVIKWIGAAADIQHFKDASVLLEQQVAERTVELRKLNTALEQQARELTRSNEDLQQFAHVASHDLKEPLRKIKTYGSRIIDEFGEQLPANVLLYLEKMESAASRMSTMIDGVLGYSMLSITEQTIDPINLNDIFLQIHNDLEVLFERKNALIRCSSLPTIHGAPVLIYQLFYNLVGNALKFSKEDRPVLILVEGLVGNGAELHPSLEQNRKYAKVTVADNGIGFNQDYASQIFKTFTRLNPKDRFEGTGLGLSLCQKIVERHKGLIYAEGVEDKGACFTVILPLQHH